MKNKQLQDDPDLTQTDGIGHVFDEMSDRYTDVMDSMVPHYRKLSKSMLGLLPEPFNPEKVLDLGCGNGNVSMLSTTLYPHAHHHLVDASEEMIQLCKKRFSGTPMTYDQNFFQSLQLSPNTYDLVLAGFSLHHLTAGEKELFFANLCPALTTKGIFACADLFLNKESAEHEQFLVDWKTFVINSGKSNADWNWLFDHYGKYDIPSTYSDHRNWLIKAGFNRVELSWNDGFWGCLHAYKA